VLFKNVIYLVSAIQCNFITLEILCVSYCWYAAGMLQVFCRVLPVCCWSSAGVLPVCRCATGDGVICQSAAGLCASGVLPVCFRCSAGRCVSGVLSVFCLLPVFCRCAAGVLLVAALAAMGQQMTNDNKQTTTTTYDNKRRQHE
jgi:hypothetical protein